MLRLLSRSLSSANIKTIFNDRPICPLFSSIFPNEGQNSVFPRPNVVKILPFLVVHLHTEEAVNLPFSDEKLIPDARMRRLSAA